MEEGCDADLHPMGAHGVPGTPEDGDSSSRVAFGDVTADMLAPYGVTVEHVTAAIAQVLEEEDTLVASAAAVVVSGVHACGRTQTQGEKRRREHQFEIDDCLQGLNEAEVFSSFRMSRADLYDLLEELRPHLQTQHPEKGVASCGHATTAGQRLLVGLRLLFGAAYQDVMIMFPPISQGRVFGALWSCVDAINAVFHGRWSFPMPPAVDDQTMEGFLERQASYEALQELERRNAAGSKEQVWRGQVGAIDGCIIKMRNPGAQVTDPKSYFCQRKQCFALLLMAMADADRRIIWCVCLSACVCCVCHVLLLLHLTPCCCSM